MARYIKLPLGPYKKPSKWDERLDRLYEAWLMLELFVLIPLISAGFAYCAMKVEGYW